MAVRPPVATPADPGISPLPRLPKQLVELLVALAHAVIHPAREDGGTLLERADQRGHGESGPAVLEGLELGPLQGDAVGDAFVGEGLHDDLVGAHLVKTAVEPE